MCDILDASGCIHRMLSKRQTILWTTEYAMHLKIQSLCHMATVRQMTTQTIWPSQLQALVEALNQLRNKLYYISSISSYWICKQRNDIAPHQ